MWGCPIPNGWGTFLFIMSNMVMVKFKVSNKSLKTWIPVIKDSLIVHDHNMEGEITLQEINI